MRRYSVGDAVILESEGTGYSATIVRDHGDGWVTVVVDGYACSNMVRVDRITPAKSWRPLATGFV